MPLSTPVQGRLTPAAPRGDEPALPSAAVARPVGGSGASRADLLGRLGAVAAEVDHGAVARRLADLADFVAADMHGFEQELDALPHRGSQVEAAAHHLLHLDGKHLRPMCVVLAAKVGRGFGDAARQVAMAVELVHSATLLHDDVVDLGETRRGAPAARLIYGNAASIFAGDWLLVEALRRVRLADAALERGASDPALLDRMLAIIEEMILAESVQLETRGRVNTALADYLRVVEGKTAALFRWAMYAGGRAGGLGENACLALERYGHHLGVAFQAVDDLLDLDGDQVATGKALFVDLREGKMTYPLIVALDRDPGLLPAVEACLAVAPGEVMPAALTSRVLGALGATGALADCRALAAGRAREAIASLAELPPGPGIEALVTVAETTVGRRR
jgi:octaprenyl-diphosphate synthase